MTEPISAPVTAPLPPIADAARPALAPSRPPWHRRLLWPAVLLAAAVVLGVLFLVWSVGRLTSSETDDAFVEAHLVNVAPEMVSGRIRFLVEENDRVEQGQPLCKIDPTHYQDQVDVAQSQVDAAQAQLDRLTAEVPIQIKIAERTQDAAEAEYNKAKEVQRLTREEVEKGIAEARAALTASTADQTLAQIEYERYSNLFQDKAATKQREQQAERARDAANAQVDLARAKLDLALAERRKNNVADRDVEAAFTATRKAERNVALAKTGDVQIREAEQQLAVRKAALDDAKHLAGYTTILAPFPGVVVKRYRNPGDYASPGVAVLSMYNPDLLYVTAYLEEDRLPGVAPGNAVRVDVDAVAGALQGRVVWIDQSTGAEFALMPRNVVSGEFTRVVQRVPVHIQIQKDNRWSQLRAGLSARVSIAHGQGDPAWADRTAKEMKELEARYNVPDSAKSPPAPGDTK